MKNYLIISCFFFITHAHAQLQENFNDGNFTSNPVWSGTVNQFTVNNSFQLQLNNTVAGTSYLSTPFQTSLLDSIVWRTTVRQAFSPSGNNYGKIYLTSDNPDLTSELHGYYLQFGEAGSNDAIELFKQNGNAVTSICRAKNGAIASSFLLQMEVIRLTSGHWQILVDYTGGTNFANEASGVDSTFTSSAWFGVWCTYTSSNASKFYYDDVYAGQYYQDVNSPTIISVNATSFNDVSVAFSEAINVASAQSLTNYFADNDIGNPLKAELQSDQKTVKLSFQKAFQNGIQNHLTISNVADLSNNNIKTVSFPFSFFQAASAQHKDIIITEILADPDPSIGLPAEEYIEVYNRGKNAIDLSRWQLSDASTSCLFTKSVIQPGKYVIVTSATSPSAFSSFSNVIALDGFPSLNNDGDDLVLKNEKAITIDSVNYSLSWYHDSDKEDGGWSLELIDLNNICGEDDNWEASIDPFGGTPGKQNSVDADKPDVTGPRLQNIFPNSNIEILLSFDEALDIHTPANGLFEITPTLQIAKIGFTDQSLKHLRLDLTTTLDSGQLYKLKAQNIADCAGNLIQDQFSQLMFSLQQSADSLDIIVNEILFNPRPLGVDFVEVYNNSKKYISLEDWKLANFEGGVLKNVTSITSQGFNIAPQGYLAFTIDSALLKTNYSLGSERDFFQTNLPSLPDDVGTIALVNDHGKIIDYFTYDAGFHTKLLKDVEGVSLERISFSGPSNHGANWKSASAQCGFATPGYLNSSSRPDPPITSGKVIVDPEIISPGSGTQEFTKITYEFAAAGYVGNLKIVDQQGRIIKTIGNNETLSVDGFFRWDGDRDDGSKARIGYYIAWFEVFDIAGVAKTYRKRIIVAGR